MLPAEAKLKHLESLLNIYYKQIEMLRNTLVEIKRLKEVAKHVAGKDEMFLPLPGLVYAHVKLSDDRLLFPIGAGYYLPFPAKEVVKRAEKKEKELEEEEKKIIEEIEKIKKESAKVIKELREEIRRQQWESAS